MTASPAALTSRHRCERPAGSNGVQAGSYSPVGQEPPPGWPARPAGLARQPRGTRPMADRGHPRRKLPGGHQRHRRRRRRPGRASRPGGRGSPGLSPLQPRRGRAHLAAGRLARTPTGKAATGSDHTVSPGTSRHRASRPNTDPHRISRQRTGSRRTVSGLTGGTRQDQAQAQARRTCRRRPTPRRCRGIAHAAGLLPSGQSPC
jgi:hypothetical protein